jgi:hypothetical protein
MIFGERLVIYGRKLFFFERRKDWESEASQVGDKSKERRKRR